MHPALVGLSDRSEILILGGGEGATLSRGSAAFRRLALHDGRLDGDVVELSKRYLPEWSAGAFEDPRARVIVGDALAYLRDDRGRTARSFPISRNRSRIRLRTRCSATPCLRTSRRGWRRVACTWLQASTAGFHNMSTHVKMRERCAGTIATCGRSTRTCRRSITTGPFSACSDAIDVAALEPATIDAYVAGLSGENYFYDAQTHARIVNLPLYLRRELAKDGDVF